MRGASLLSGLTPCLFADLCQEVYTSSIPLAEVPPCATKRTCSAWRTGISIDGGGHPILSGIADGKCCYFVDQSAFPRFDPAAYPCPDFVAGGGSLSYVIDAAGGACR